MIDKALQYAAAHHDTQLKELTDWLAIPSISAQPEEHGEDIKEAAHWLANRFKAAGMQRAELMQTDGNPVVYAEWSGAPGAPTVLVYGHYDVQPPDPLEEWHSDPFQAQVRDGKLYARGAADDKGQVYIHVKSAEAYLQGAGALPVNLKFFVEGEEEVGSQHLGEWVAANADLLKADVALISDSHMLAEDTPTIIYGLRGLTYMEVEVRSADHDLHSGTYGGCIHNPIQVLCELLAGLKDAQGHITVPGFYDKVRALSDEERAELKRVPFNEREFLNEVGATQTWGEEGYTVLERVSARPTLEINGIWGGYSGAGQKTVLPARAAAKISMRLVADQDADAIAQLVEDHLCRAAPPSVRLVVRKLAASPAALVERNTPQMVAAAQAYQSVFNARPVFMREGGSIPIVTDIQARLHMPVILMGFGLPDDNLHAPNEKLNLNQFYRGIRTSIHLFNNLVKSSP